MSEQTETIGFYILLVLPLGLLFLKGRFGTIEFDKTIVWVFFIYLMIATIYVFNNEGKAQSGQVIWIGGHFSIMKEPEAYGDYVVFTDGISWPMNYEYKKNTLVVHKDNYQKIGNSYYVNAVGFKRTYYEIPEDAKKIFRTYKYQTDNIIIALVNVVTLDKQPDINFFENSMARLSDENEQNRKHAVAKMEDLEGMAVSVGRLGDIGGKKSMIEKVVEKVSTSPNKDETTK
jgi:hypothetical protein